MARPSIWSLAIAALLATGVGAQQTVYEPGNGVTLPTVTHEARPEYTREALDAHIEGTVLLSVVVENDGKVGAVDVERSLDPTYGLDQQAVKAMKGWTFKPGTKDGKPVAVHVHVELSFKLK